MNYYQLNFALEQHHKWSLSEIEMMWPWEREIYVAQIKNWVDQENERIKALNNGQTQ